MVSVACCVVLCVGRGCHHGTGIQNQLQVHSGRYVLADCTCLALQIRAAHVGMKRGKRDVCVCGRVLCCKLCVVRWMYHVCCAPCVGVLGGNGACTVSVTR